MVQNVRFFRTRYFDRFGSLILVGIKFENDDAVKYSLLFAGIGNKYPNLYIYQRDLEEN